MSDEPIDPVVVEAAPDAGTPAPAAIEPLTPSEPVVGADPVAPAAEPAVVEPSDPAPKEAPAVEAEIIQGFLIVFPLEIFSLERQRVKLLRKLAKN